MNADNPPATSTSVSQSAAPGAYNARRESSEAQLHEDVDMNEDDEDEEGGEERGDERVDEGGGDEDGSDGSEEDEGEVEVEEELDQAEVDDIRSNLATALKNSGDAGGAFSFSKTYNDAPNPTLTLADLGAVGLPLSTREAAALKSRCVQAPFGKGERTLVDKSVRDTWEMDASLVSFENPDWNTFISRVAGEVCSTLGVNCAASQPRCELYKLLLYETGSHFLPHVDTEKVKGMFATIIIVLPSRFTGGAAHLSHGSLFSVYDCSSTSHFRTTAMAWYTDVTHEIKPVTSGYRLALSYNLIHTTQTLRPALASNTEVVDELRRIMSLWNKAELYDAPQKLFYLLDHEYSQANLNAAAMKGKDAQRVALLDVLAKQLGFGIGFASVCCHVTGSCEDDNGYGYESDDYYGYRGRCGGRRERSGDWTMGEVDTREMSIEHFVDMDGSLITDNLDFDEETEMIPENLADIVEGGICDDEEYEGYQGNYAGTLEQWYRRTVLVLWPSWQNHGILYQGIDGFGRACRLIASTKKATPSLEDTDLALHVLRQRSMNYKLAAQSVCKAATMWKDSRLWCRAVEDCAVSVGVDLLSNDQIHTAIKLFGWEKVVASLDKMLQSDAHNATRLNFLKQLESWVDTPQDPPVSAEAVDSIRAWVVVCREDVFVQLKKPLLTEGPALLSIVHDKGGLEYLRERMLPQLQAVADEEFLRHFARQVFNDEALGNIDAKRSTLAPMLAIAVSKATLYDPNNLGTTQRAGYPYYHQPPVLDRCALAKTYVQLCIELDCLDVLDSIISRVMDNTGRSQAQISDCAKTVMLPLVSHFAEQATRHPRIVQISQFRALQTTAIKTFLDGLSQGSSTTDVLTKAQASTLIDAAVVGDDPTVFIGSVVPRLENMKLAGSGWQVLIEGLNDKRARFKFSPGYPGRSLDDILRSFGRKYLSTANLPGPQVIIRTLDWCSSVGLASLYDIILDRITSSAALNQTAWVTSVVGAIPDLRKWGDQNNCTDSLGPAFAKILIAWTSKVLGPLPAGNASLATHLTALARWNSDCNCVHCAQARTFITQTPRKSENFERIGAPSRKHLEQKLNTWARPLVTFTMIRSVPQGLTIHKTDPLFKLVSWRANQAQGLRYVKSIGATDADIQRRLGPQYNQVMQALHGVSTSQTASASSSAHGGPPPAKRQRI